MRELESKNPLSLPCPKVRKGEKNLIKRHEDHIHITATGRVEMTVVFYVPGKRFEGATKLVMGNF
jgi:hypothetical protein